MAAIEDLIKQIADTRLRDQLAAEVARLKSQKKFGLVFEEHLPELLRLPGMAARLGSRVLKKDDPRGVPYRVTAEVNGKRIKVRPDAGGDEETIERAAVVVAHAFGEPMFPALIPVDSVERAPGKPWHVLINADNYHALQLLLYGYESKVDVIYIDPPYNTGARDWKYNNDYVDDADQSRHSKWLAMMKRRLLLARRLLNPADSVLIATIDEKEYLRLGLLLEEVFSGSAIQMVTTVIKPEGTGRVNEFSRTNEFIFYVSIGKAQISATSDNMYDRDGSEGGQPGDPKAVVLWLSDQPQLNEQSKKKIAEASDRIPPHRLVTIEHPFNPERLLPGHVYFLNNQKLTVSSLITKQGDKQERTIWQIIEATTKAAPASFYLVIDEAHRGMQDAERGDAARKSAETKRMTITQKFIKGDAGVGDPPTPLSAVPLVIGISATPERFNRVLEGTTRTVHPVVVESENVRGSGLIKDRIKLAVADEGDEADWSMLADSAKKWAKYRDEWAAYCAKNQIVPVIAPVLVVQVENGTKEQPTKTNLATCLKVIQDAVGHLPGNAFAHCFEDDADVPAGAVVLRKVEASKIQHDSDLRVVFFKTALTTGWDCPRAEVMMSFRAAQDSTLIAQLVGRMVRTPLARRVESNEFLNGVSLALPHYDEDAVKDIIKKLEDADAGATGEVVEEREMVLYKKSEGKDDLFDALAKVPTYVVTRPRRMPETSRLMKIARRLSMDGVGEGLMGKAKRFVIDQLLTQRDRLRKDPEWAARVDGTAKVPVKEFTIEYGLWKLENEPASYMIEATEENIYELFQRCAGVLGENLHDSYANRAEFRGDINAARLELFCIVQDEKALKAVQQACEQEFSRIWHEHKDDIAQMSAPAQERYRDLRRRGGYAAAETLIIRDNIEVRAEKPFWESHLYVNPKGKFGWNANTWEKPLLEAEMERPGFSGFLRNMPRKDWALCIPYGSENDKSLYPDMLIFRRVKSKVVIDILDPHGDQFADALGKAQGLAHYAKSHGDLFGRIEMIRIERGKAERLDLQDEKVRGKVLRATSAEQLADLYVEHG